MLIIIFILVFFVLFCFRIGDVCLIEPNNCCHFLEYSHSIYIYIYIIIWVILMQSNSWRISHWLDNNYMLKRNHTRLWIVAQETSRTNKPLVGIIMYTVFGKRAKQVGLIVMFFVCVLLLLYYTNIIYYNNECSELDFIKFWVVSFRSVPPSPNPRRHVPVCTFIPGSKVTHYVIVIHSVVALMYNNSSHLVRPGPILSWERPVQAQSTDTDSAIKSTGVCKSLYVGRTMRSQMYIGHRDTTIPSIWSFA